MMPRFCAVMLLTGTLCVAQSAPVTKDTVKFYKLDFVVKDIDAGKLLTARNYSVIVRTDGPESLIRAGSKVPVSPNYSYVDVGTNIDCKGVLQMADDLIMTLKVEVSNVMDNGPNPVIRQNSWQSAVTVPLKKPTVVFFSDDNTTKRTLEFEVTATPLPEHR